MKKKIHVTLQDVTEDDIRNAFSDAFTELGVKGGDQIPSQYVDLRECLIYVLFEHKKTLEELSSSQMHDYFRSGV